MANLSVPRPHRDQPSDMSSVISFTTASGHAIISGAAIFSYKRPCELSPARFFSSSSPSPEQFMPWMARHSAAELQNWPHRCKGWLSLVLDIKGAPELRGQTGSGKVAAA
jgi:hypothetical protein